jgi:hypothetical protein
MLSDVLWITGGKVAGTASPLVKARRWEGDDWAGEWLQRPKLNTARSAHSSHQLGDKLLVLAGSDVARRPLDSLELLGEGGWEGFVR